MFQSCAPSPNNARVKRHKPQQSRRCGLWWEESSPWEDWLVTWQALRISTKNMKKKVVETFSFLFCLVFPTCNFFLEYDPRFSVAPFQMRPEGPESPVQHTFTFLTKRYNVVLSFRTTRVRVPLARNPSPLQYPTFCVHVNSVRSLLRQPRSALEAGPSEAHAISFVHTPRPHLHRTGCTFSYFCFCQYQRNNG